MLAFVDILVALMWHKISEYPLSRIYRRAYIEIHISYAFDDQPAALKALNAWTLGFKTWL